MTRRSRRLGAVKKRAELASAELHGARAALQVPAVLLRLSALEAEGAKLLAEIAKCQEKARRLDALLEDAENIASLTLRPLVREIEALEEEVHALFGELLLLGRLPKAARGQVRALYGALQARGVLGERGAAQAAQDREAAAEERRAQREPPHADTHPAPSAREPRDTPFEDSLRVVFRRLALAMHPDTAEEGPERARRTEAMKEITRAHGQRDLARLLELSRLWLATGVATPDAAGNDAEARCQAQERTNASLRKQLRLAERTLRKEKSSPLALAILDAGQSGGGRALAEIVVEVTQERDRVRDVRDLVRGYRDGKVSLAALSRG